MVSLAIVEKLHPADGATMVVQLIRNLSDCCLPLGKRTLGRERSGEQALAPDREIQTRLETTL